MSAFFISNHLIYNQIVGRSTWFWDLRKTLGNIHGFFYNISINHFNYGIVKFN